MHCRKDKALSWYRWIVIAITSSAISACGPQWPIPSASEPAGHYEGTNQRGMQIYSGKQSIVPTYEPTRSVAINWELLAHYNTDGLLTALINAGVSRIFITTPANASQLDGYVQFQAQLDALDQKYPAIEFSQVTTEQDQIVSNEPNPWISDWAPLRARVNDRNEKPSLRLVDFNDPGKRPFEDSVSAALERKLGVPRISLPVYHRGNALTNNAYGDCLISQNTVNQNAVRLQADDYRLTSNQVAEYFQLWGGCTKVYFVENLPHDNTGNLNQFLRFITGDHVLIADIRSDALTGYGVEPELYTRALSIDRALHTLAERMGSFGYYVRRVPMALPVFDRDGQAILRSYTASLFINRSVILPRFKKPQSLNDGNILQEITTGRWESRYPDNDFLEKYEETARQVYRSLGLEVAFVDADEFVAHGHSLADVVVPVDIL